MRVPVSPSRERNISEKINVCKDIVDLITKQGLQNVSNAITKGRHQNIFGLLLVQNVFMNGKHSKRIVERITLYKETGQIECLGRQLFGKGESKRFVELYKKVALSRPRGYSLTGFGCKSPDKI